MSARRPVLPGRAKVSRRSKRPGRSRAGSSESARLVAATSRTLAGFGFGLDSWRCGGRKLLSTSTMLPTAFCSPVGVSKDCIWTSSSFTTPPVPSETVLFGLPTAPPPGGLPQHLEDRPQLRGGCAVEQRLERCRGDEQEWHPGLRRHRLGQQ